MEEEEDLNDDPEDYNPDLLGYGGYADGMADYGHDNRPAGVSYPSPSFYRYFGVGRVMEPGEWKPTLAEVRRALGGEEAEETVLREIRHDIFVNSRPPDTMKCLSVLTTHLGSAGAAAVMAGPSATLLLNRMVEDSRMSTLHRVATDVLKRVSGEGDFDLHEIGLWLTEHICVCDTCWW